jgi:hypothetical protein
LDPWLALYADFSLCFYVREREIELFSKLITRFDEKSCLQFTVTHPLILQVLYLLKVDMNWKYRIVCGNFSTPAMSLTPAPQFLYLSFQKTCFPSFLFLKSPFHDFEE